MTAPIDPTIESWLAGGFFFTEAARGGPLVWEVGAKGLRGDPLGPIRHVHDGAGEYYYLFKGSCLVEIGGHELEVKRGELAYIPPDVPHNFLGPTSADDVYLFVVVAPNHFENKWRTKDFRPEAATTPGEVGVPFEDEDLPAGGALSSQACRMEAGGSLNGLVPRMRESVYLVTEGELGVRLADGLGGAIAAGGFVHVREGLRHDLATRRGCRFLRIDSAFEPWAGVERGTTTA